MLSPQPLTLTELDVVRLEALSERLERLATPPATLPVLERELERAIVVKPEAIPAGVVTMNSRVEVEDLETGARSELTLVFPALAGIEEGRVSVLAPLGLALLGGTVGNRVTRQTPRGERHMRIVRLAYQPEAAGRFDL